MAKRSWPQTVSATRAARCCPVLSEIRPLPLAAERQPFRRDHLDLDVEGQRQREDVEARTEIGRRGREPGARIVDAQLFARGRGRRLARGGRRPAGRSRSEEAVDRRESR